jgi:hypothetical protein
MSNAPTATGGRVLVLACGALAREVLAVVRANGWEHVDVRCLPASLHSTPARIPSAVDAALSAVRGRYAHAFVAYADCGTAGVLDAVLEAHGAERLPGAHCYAVFAGLREWDELQEAEPGTFYLTDFLVRQFEALVVRPLGLDRHPELVEAVFGNYRRVVYLAQTDDPELLRQARGCAERLGLAFEHRPTGYGRLEPSLTRFVALAGVA